MLTSRLLVAVGVVSSLAFVTSQSAAQAANSGSFGQQGQFIFSANRLFDAYAYGNYRYHPDNSNNQDTVVQGTSAGGFGGTSALLGLSPNALKNGSYGTVYNVPRLGFDYTVFPNLAVGGDLLVYFALGGSTHQDPNSTSSDIAGMNLFGIFPHVGYIVGVNDLLSFWLRGGLHFWNAQIDGKCGGSDSLNVHAFGLDVEPSVVISPVQHFAFFAGPALDWGTGGVTDTQLTNAPTCNSQQSTNYGLTALNFSFTAGLVGWF